MEELYWFWLCNIPGIWQLQIEKLIKKFKSPEDIFRASERQLEESRSLEKKEIAMLLASKNMDEMRRKLEKIKRDGIRFIYCTHPEFPEKLKNIPDRPFSLYVKGRLPDETAPAIGMVGARNCTGYGKEIAVKYSDYFARNGVQIISGMAEGIDTCAAVGAMKNGGKTFAVLGTGIDLIYPYKNVELYFKIPEYGGLISEYPMGTPGVAWHFPHRNRLISALSDKLLIIEAGKRSGTLTTARHALNQGVDIYALPGRINDPLSAGCNMLISEGCGVLLDASYILEQFYAKHTFRNDITRKKTAEMSSENCEKSISDVNFKEESNETKQNEKIDCMNKSAEKEKTTCIKAIPDKNVSDNKRKFNFNKKIPKPDFESKCPEEIENLYNSPGEKEMLEKVWKCLNYNPQNIQKIMKKTGAAAVELTNILTELELAGYIEETTKDYFAKCVM